MAISIISNRCPQNHRCPLLFVCPADAITQNGIELPKIDKSKCTDCGKCIRFCAMGAVQNI